MGINSDIFPVYVKLLQDEHLAMKLDRTDKHILEILQKDARITNAELAERINLSPTACLKRVKKIESSGVIKGYKAVLDPEKLGFNIHGMVLLKIGDTGREAVLAFSEALKDIPAVTECHMSTGRTDYVAKFYARDFHHYEELVKDNLACLPNIVSMETLFLFSNLAPEDNFKL